ncbi:MAG: hypothetical protein JO107_08465, partial [Hyphomicrobiales bacterium]|nr:hypothetical protein [Hyphomicrobiales bacterium]
IPHADFINTNLSKDEVQALLNPDTPQADKRALVEKLKADKISAPTIEIAPKDGAKLKLRDVLASNVDSGRVERFGFAGAESSTTGDASPVSLKSGPMQIEGLDVADALKAVDGSGGGKTGRLEHLTWSDIDIVAPDSQGPASKPVRIALGGVELRSGYSGDTLKDGSTKLSGVVIEPAPDSDAGKNLAALGYAKVELAAEVDATYEAHAKTLTLDNFTIDGLGMGSIAVKANFTDVPPELLSGDSAAARLPALLGCGIASLELRLVNAGLFEKSLALAAKQQGVTPEALAQQWAAMVGQMAPLFLAGSPSALAAAAETQKFIASPHSLTVSLKAKGGPLTASDLAGVSDPAAFLGKVDIAAKANP